MDEFVTHEEVGDFGMYLMNGIGPSPCRSTISACGKDSICRKQRTVERAHGALNVRSNQDVPQGNFVGEWGVMAHEGAQRGLRSRESDYLPPFSLSFLL